MRREMKEYNLDWMLASVFNVAWKTYGGATSSKEFATLLRYIPYFRNTMAPFETLGEVGREFLKVSACYLDNIVHAHERGKKTAIMTFCYSPAILYAMDVVPITLEIVSVMSTLLWKRGTAEYLDYCNEVGFTETSCSSQRGTLGAYLAGLGTDIDMVLIDSPGVCDTNANAFAFAAAYLDKPFYQLNMPSTLTDERATAYHRADYRNMITFLEEQTGKKLDRDRLRVILEEIRKQDAIIDELEELQRLVPNPAPAIYPFIQHAARFLFAGMKECTGVLELMRAQVRRNAAAGVSGLASGTEKLRGFFFYIDHYTTSMRLWEMLDRNGVTHIGNILSRSWDADAPLPKYTANEGEAYRVDTTDLDTMIDSMAKINARMPMIKSIRGPYDRPHMWLEDSLALAKMYNVDFMVYSGTPGCRNTWGMVKLLARDTEKAGYPTHLMYSDAFDDRVESWEQTQERFEEFLRVRRLA